MTQIEYARKGIITPQMKHVAATEQRPEQFIAERVAAGTIVIPANIRHSNLQPMGIGRELFTKINANIGNSSLTGTPEEELEKLRSVLAYGSDTVMDLSTGGNIPEIRRSILQESTIPVGTVPVYEVVARYSRNGITQEHILEVIREQAEQGVDYMTIHAGLLRKYVPLALKRKLGIVSRGGALLAAWMQKNGKENPPSFSPVKTRHKYAQFRHGSRKKERCVEISEQEIMRFLPSGNPNHEEQECMQK